MASIVLRPWLLLVLAYMALAEQTRLFIDQVPAFKSQAPCALTPISTIVKYMNDGCGDNKQTTSYNCFCSSSSSYFSSLIGSKVEKACQTDNPDFQRTAAVALFDAYCHLGDSLTSGKSDSYTHNVVTVN